MKAAPRVAALWSLLVLVGACDPCSGVVGCTVSPRLSVVGQLLDSETGQPVAGATIDFIRTSGAPLTPDSIRATTDREGLFQLDGEAGANVEIVGDMVVRLPGTGGGPVSSSGGYRVLGVRVVPTTRRGEARVLPPWTTAPKLPDVAEISRRGDPPMRLVGIEIEFRRTGGIQVAELMTGPFRATTNADGWVPLFGNRVHPLEAGELIGDLHIFDTVHGDTTVHRNVRLTATPTFADNAWIHLFGAGPNLTYHFQVDYRGTGAHAVGTRVDFTTISGIDHDTPNWTRTVDANGRVWFPGRAREHGVVVGDLTVTPPPPAKAYTRRVELPTYDEDGGKLYGILGVGPGLHYYAIIRNAGAPLKGAEVEFQHTGGIAVTPARFVVTTNDTGIVSLNTAPSSEGEVIADITVRPPAPLAGFTVRGVRMQAVDADVPGGRVLLGDWDVTSPPPSPQSVMIAPRTAPSTAARCGPARSAQPPHDTRAACP